MVERMNTRPIMAPVGVVTRAQSPSSTPSDTASAAAR